MGISLRRRRGLQLEMLESRDMLAGDTYLLNFQSDEATTPTRYLRDTGQLLGNRGGGLFYGWSSDHTDQVRERSLVPDQRFDTLVHIEAGQDWEFQIANGTYEVTVAVGDPAFNDGIHTVNVEGVNFFNAVPDDDQPKVLTLPVTVADGRLTLDAGAAAEKATRLNYIHIVGLPSGPNLPPSPPLITEPSVDGQEVSPFDVHMEAVGFSDPDGDAHKSTDWEIWTVGTVTEPVWQTLGITGVERLHTHLGDGIFINGLAGRNELDELTDYVLLARYRDDAGSTSSYAARLFTTAPASTTFPLELKGFLDQPAPNWQDVLGSNVELPSEGDVLSANDAIIAIDLDGNSDYPFGETPSEAVDGTLAKYLNFGEVNSGFIVTPVSGPSTISSFRITTANDAVERDPTAWSLFGTNSPISSPDNSQGNLESWQFIDSGTVNLPSQRNTLGPVVSVDNSSTYSSYRMVFTGVKNAGAANSMQIAEIEFTDDSATPGNTSTLRIEAAQGEELLRIEGAAAAGNNISYAPLLATNEPVRVVIEADERGFNLAASDLRLTGDDTRSYTIFLPAIALGPNESLYLWVANSGATYFGSASDTQPDFTNLARAAGLDIPFIANRPGFVIEEVGNDYRLPVNIAFVPDPGPNPDDPLYYVTELYGSIQVVTRDGTKSEFATGLLDYNPQGPISGSGEQGLTGIAVQRDPANPEIYNLYVGMLWDNGAPPGGASHYPKVEKIASTEGGLTLGSRTVLLNMQPETQGQSHQISNISIGPDNKLYVHNGDGFDASTAQDLNQYRGKILRLNLDGTAASDNPFYNAGNGINARDYVYAYGLRNPFGGAWRAADGKLYQVENGPSVDRFAQVNRGVNYGWDGSNGSMTINAIYNWVPAHAPVNITFVQPETFNGSQLPVELQDRAFVAESGGTYAAGPQATGKRITEFTLNASGTLVGGPETLIEYVGDGRSTVVALAAGPDGLYFSTLYEDTGDNGPTASGARLYRVRYENPLAGDYDIDGDVDTDDYNVWVETFGSNLLLAADGNRNGVVDAADFTVWRDNLGNTLPNNSSGAMEQELGPTMGEQDRPEIPSKFADRAIVENPTVNDREDARSTPDKAAFLPQPFVLNRGAPAPPSLHTLIERVFAHIDQKEEEEVIDSRHLPGYSNSRIG